MSELVVRVYKILFGDAILISVPDRAQNGTETLRHILIDVGNMLFENPDTYFEPVVRDIEQRIGKRPIDLYVMTHEHLDHIHGLPYVEKKFGRRLRVDYAWLTASAEPGYYRRFPEAEKKKKLAELELELVKRFAAVSRGALPAAVTSLVENNDPVSTSACVDYLRALAQKGKTRYIHSKSKLSGAHPFEELSLSVWAPEENTADYYGRFQPMSLGLTGDGPKVTATAVLPPPGVDAGAFYDLVQARADGYADNLLTIDKANNNTSVVLCLEWRGWRLLFTGDAEQRSWKTMAREKVLAPVHFLKVGHHGSWNGSPPRELLDKILPIDPPDQRPRWAAVSTHDEPINGVPDPDTLKEIGRRAKLLSTQDLDDGGSLEFKFAG